ncbi:MAG TPA: SxtJ family membrane protein [Longimicrobiales bacterium]
MAERVPARLSAAEGRRFAYTVGAAFVVLAGIVRWRGGSTAALVLAAIGAALLLAGTVVPAHLGPVQRAWMGLAHAISRVTTPVLLVVVYYVTVVPIGLLMRALGRNPLVHRAAGSGYWVERAAENRRSDLERQF